MRPRQRNSTPMVERALDHSGTRSRLRTLDDCTEALEHTFDCLRDGSQDAGRAAVTLLAVKNAATVQMEKLKATRLLARNRVLGAQFLKGLTLSGRDSLDTLEAIPRYRATLRRVEQEVAGRRRLEAEHRRRCR